MTRDEMIEAMARTTAIHRQQLFGLEETGLSQYGGEAMADAIAEATAALDAIAPALIEQGRRQNEKWAIALQKIATGSIKGESRNCRDALAIVRAIAAEALEGGHGEV